MLKQGLMVALVAAVAATTTFAPGDAEAKRLGSGRSSGLQRSMPERTAPNATPATPAAQPGAQPGAPAQQAAGTAATAGTAAAAAGKRSWLGPIAGLAAGLGLAALASHLGFGEAFANILMIALLAMAAFALFAFLRRRMAGPAPAGAPGMARSGPAGQVAWPPAGAAGSAGSSAPRTEPAFEPAASRDPSATPVAAAFVPAAFDSESFERIAKAIFIRMQAANDASNLDDLRQFTTPEMFASLKLDLLDRGPATQTTDVKRVEAKVLDVAEEGERQVVSVRYTGEVVEAAGQPAVAFDEVWHLVKPRASEGAWLIAGIEQMA